MKSYLLSRRMLANLFVLGFLGVWFLTLAPTAIHGPAAYIEVSGHSMDGTYRTGDLILTHTRDTYGVGDIITFKVPAGSGEGQVIHRIIGGNGATGYTTQGDNNPDPDPWHPTDADVVGQAWKRFEGKAWMLHLPRQPWFAGVTAGLLTLVVLGIDALPRRRSTPAEVPDEVLTEVRVPDEVSVDVEPLPLVEAGGPRIPAQRHDSATAPVVGIPRQAAGPRWRRGRRTPPVEQPVEKPADDHRGRS